jgi:hypothetical protein
MVYAFNVSEPSTMETKMRELIDRIEEQPSASQYLSSERANQPSYLFELLKYEYKWDRIERYINLTIIETEEQQEKEAS